MGDFWSDLGQFSGLTTPALLGMAIVLLFRGLLVPFVFYREMRDSRDAWKAAAERAQAASAEKDKQISMLLEANTTATRVLESLPPPKG